MAHILRTKKWLKDCALYFDYILHFQKIIVALF